MGVLHECWLSPTRVSGNASDLMGNVKVSNIIMGPALGPKKTGGTLAGTDVL